MIHNSSLTTKALEAEYIWDEWFPEVKADVFISHSSKDAALAKLLASWLEQYYQLTAFIDSEIWGHSDELLKELDDEYCVKDRSNCRATIYSYEKRNGSTAHVHMLLCYWNQVYENGLAPYLARDIPAEQAWQRSVVPVREFLFRYTRQEELSLMTSMRSWNSPYPGTGSRPGSWCRRIEDRKSVV